uniref:Secreted protein n=1 Tax=Panagrellus redivivus TaxID=6233 RepID=A0A7E4V515_PANRE
MHHHITLTSTPPSTQTSSSSEVVIVFGASGWPQYRRHHCHQPPQPLEGVFLFYPQRAGTEGQRRHLAKLKSDSRRECDLRPRRRSGDTPLSNSVVFFAFNTTPPLWSHSSIRPSRA